MGVDGRDPLGLRKRGRKGPNAYWEAFWSGYWDSMSAAIYGGNYDMTVDQMVVGYNEFEREMKFTNDACDNHLWDEMNKTTWSDVGKFHAGVIKGVAVDLPKGIWHMATNPSETAKSFANPNDMLGQISTAYMQNEGNIDFHGRMFGISLAPKLWGRFLRSTPVKTTAWYWGNKTKMALKAPAQNAALALSITLSKEPISCLAPAKPITQNLSSLSSISSRSIADFSANIVPSSIRPGVAGTMVTKSGEIFEAFSIRKKNGKPVYRKELQDVLDYIKLKLGENKGAGHGRCFEPQVINQMLEKYGRIPEGTISQARIVKGCKTIFGHADKVGACRSCRMLLKYYNIKDMWKTYP